MTSKFPGDVQQGRFAYSQRALAFLPRHSRLEALEQTADQGFRVYISEFLRGWMSYLDHGEVVLLRQDPVTVQIPYTADNGMKSQTSGEYSERMHYNFQDSMLDPGTIEIRSHEFAAMDFEERQDLLRQHPEIVLSLDRYDGLFKEGLLPDAFGAIGYHGIHVIIKPLAEFLTPEEYIRDMGEKKLYELDIQLRDDTLVYLLDGNTVAREGEVCINCLRVDP